MPSETKTARNLLDNGETSIYVQVLLSSITFCHKTDVAESI